MKIIKLSAISSTNDYLKSLSAAGILEDGLVVVANKQTHGRGQRGNTWFSEPGKSLSFSIYKGIDGILAEYAYVLTMCVSLGVKKALETLEVPNIFIKWPNDILAGSKKLCGILIENKLQGNMVSSSIIGIGINVNNDIFQKLPSATSMKLTTAHTYDIEEVLKKIYSSITSELNRIGTDSFEHIKRDYEQYLFKKGKVAVFTQNNSKPFNAVILGVSNEGKLRIELEDKTIQEFQSKEISMIY